MIRPYKLTVIVYSLEKKKDKIEENAKNNHYLDYNKIETQYKTLLATMRWAVGLDKENLILDKLIKISEEK